jgi:N-acetylneuraminic acid mutarotase
MTWNLRLFIAVGVCLVFMLPAPAFAQAANLKWQKAAPFPEPEEELYGASANGKMYVMGGYGEGGSPVGMNWEYDPNTDKWTKKAGMPVKAHHAAMASYDGKIYVFGGYTLYRPAGSTVGGGWKPIDNAWEFNPATNTWKALAPLPTKRGSPIAAEVNGKIYVIGGTIGDPKIDDGTVYPNRSARSLGTNEVYDPATNTWRNANPMPTPRNHMFVGVVNSKIYVIGGRYASSFITVATNSDLVEEYDPATDTWGPENRARLTMARSGGGFATHNGLIYVAGGEVQTAQYLGAFRSLEAYDPAKNVWYTLPVMPYPRHGVATAFLGNRLHLVSGKITSGGAPDTQLSTASHDVLEIPDSFGR